MYAERFVTRTDSNGCLTGLPVFPVDEEVEVIVLCKERPMPRRLDQQALEQAYRDAAAEIDEAGNVSPYPDIDIGEFFGCWPELLEREAQGEYEQRLDLK